MVKQGRPKHAIWKEFALVVANDNRPLKDVICNYCGTVLHKAQPNRKMLRHLLDRCSEIPVDKRTEWETFVRAAKRQKFIKQKQQEAKTTVAAMLGSQETERDVAEQHQTGEGVVSEDTLQICRRRIRARWRFIHKSSLKLAYFLDHTKTTSVFSEDEISLLIQEIVLLAVKLGYSDSELEAMQGQLSRFMTRKLQWSPADKRGFFKVPPVEWWTWIGIADYPLVALIAQRIFTIPTSSASTERAWSVLGNVYSLRRNSLGNEKAHMLAAISINHGDKLSDQRIEFQALLGDQELIVDGTELHRAEDLENDSDYDVMDDSDASSDSDSFNAIVGGDLDQDSDAEPAEVLEVLQASPANRIRAVTDAEREHAGLVYTFIC